jgi:hypothetical protein
MEAVPGGGKRSTVRASNITGAFVIAKGGGFAFDFTGEAFLSELKATGAFRPCAPGDMEAEIKSDAFDFDDLKTFLSETFLDDSRWLARAPGGRGELSVRVAGPMQLPVVSGRANLRDADFSFSWSGDTLTLAQFRAGIGPDRVEGHGEVSLASANWPFTFTLFIRKLSLARLLGGSVSPEYLPSGDVSGNLRLQGSLKGSDALSESGQLQVSEGSLKVPRIALGGQGADLGAATFALDGATARMAIMDGALRIYDIHATGGGLSLTGSGRITGGLEIVRGLSRSTQFTFDLSLTGPARAIADRLTASSNLVTGAATARVRVQGSFAASTDISASGTLSVRNGSLRAPAGESKSIAFRTLHADFNAQPGALTVSKFSVVFEGGHVEGGIGVGHDQITGGGTTTVSADVMNLFPSLSDSFHGSADGTVSANFTLSGAPSSPQISWSVSGQATDSGVEAPQQPDNSEPDVIYQSH